MRKKEQLKDRLRLCNLPFLDEKGYIKIKLNLKEKKKKKKHSEYIKFAKYGPSFFDLVIIYKSQASWNNPSRPDKNLFLLCWLCFTDLLNYNALFWVLFVIR